VIRVRSERADPAAARGSLRRRADPENFALEARSSVRVRPTSAGPGAVGSTYATTRDLPTCRTDNELEITAHESLPEFATRTLSGPPPFVYGYASSSSTGTTLLALAAEVAPGAGALMGPLAGRTVKEGVGENFAILKQVLETRPSHA
jgi:hypothetical protein